VPDLKDILNEDDDHQNDDLLKYVQGDLSEDDQYKVEQQMNNSDFVSDAMEGLQNIRNKRSIGQYVDELNRQLHHQVEKKKKRKEKRRLKEYPWITTAAMVVLGLCLLAYIVIRYYQKPKNDDANPASTSAPAKPVD
jgi:uncharacterized membrane-anchored protein YjiN (DUF445 family)